MEITCIKCSKVIGNPLSWECKYCERYWFNFAKNEIEEGNLEWERKMK